MDPKTTSIRRLRPEALRKRRVLVVDDGLDAVHSMAMLIKMMGHEVQFAINGFAALECARRFKPEVVLLDIHLPDFKGDEIARQLRWEPGLQNVRIIAMSGRSDDETQRRVKEAGVAEFAKKPIGPVELERLLEAP
jgi:CheY-like chemotaxis protein